MVSIYLKASSRPQLSFILVLLAETASDRNQPGMARVAVVGCLTDAAALLSTSLDKARLLSKLDFRLNGRIGQRIRFLSLVSLIDEHSALFLRMVRLLRCMADKLIRQIRPPTSRRSRSRCPSSTDTTHEPSLCLHTRWSRVMLAAHAWQVGAAAGAGYSSRQVLCENHSRCVLLNVNSSRDHHDGKKVETCSYPVKQDVL